jgi:hypothetical protein
MTSDPHAAAAYCQAFEDDIRERIWLCELTIAQAREQIDRLRAQISYPRVLVTLHYKQWAAPCTSDAAEGDTLEQAYHLLYHITLDNGDCWPVGVEVGGCMVTWDELIEEFGEYRPW